MTRLWILCIATALGGCVAATEPSRFPAAEPQMPMVTYYDPVQESPLGPPVRHGAIANDPQNPGGEAPIS